MRNKHSKRMKTLAELREGIEDLVKSDKLKYYTDSDWTKKKLTEFVIKQDEAQDRKDAEKKEAPLPDNDDKKGKERSEESETPTKEPENTKSEELEAKESAKSLPIKDDKIEGEVHVIISKLYDEIEDNIRSKVGFFLYDVVYEDETVGTLKITSKSLKEFAVNPYEYTQAILSLEDRDLNIKIRAERDVKESLQINEAMSNTGFGAIIGGITGLFSGNGTIFTLGSTIFGAIFGSIKDKREEGEQEQPLWKRIVQKDAEDRKALETKLKEVRGGFVLSMDADDFKDEDVYNAMNFFYDPETGLPRSADDIRKAMDGCDQKDIDALIEKASKYREDNEDEVRAFNEWTKSLPKEKLDEVDKLNKMNFEELSATKEVDRIDKDIKTLEAEMKKIEDEDDEVSRRAYNKMKDELDEKKSSRTKAVDKVRDIQSSKKSQQEKVDEITKDHPLPDEITNNRERQQIKQELAQQKKADAEQKKKDKKEKEIDQALQKKNGDEPKKDDKPKKDDEPKKDEPESTDETERTINNFIKAEKEFEEAADKYSEVITNEEDDEKIEAAKKEFEEKTDAFADARVDLNDKMKDNKEYQKILDEYEKSSEEFQELLAKKEEAESDKEIEEIDKKLEDATDKYHDIQKREKEIVKRTKLENGDKLEKAKEETIKDPDTGEKIKVKVQRARGVRGGKKYRIKRDGQWGEWYYGTPTRESLQDCEDVEIVAEGRLKTLKELK